MKKRFFFAKKKLFQNSEEMLWFNLYEQFIYNFVFRHITAMKYVAD